MAHPDPLLDLIHRTPAATELLTWPFDFDVSRTDPVEVVRLESGEALEAVAGDGAGGTFFLCGEAAGERPVLYANFPKGTDLSRWGAEELAAVAFTLNTRPRKTLGWKTPAEAFSDHLNSLLSSSVATTA